MTREEILLMPAGREMNIAVLKSVMGWRHVQTNKFTYTYIQPEYGAVINWSPSTDISAALMVLKTMAHEPFAWSIETINTTDGLRYFVCYWGDGTEPGTVLEWSDESDSLSLSICRVALLVKLTKAEG